MTKRLIPKKIDRISTHGETHGEAPLKRVLSGVGHIIIPNDMDRLEYINSVRMTGKGMIVTTFNSPINNVIIPKHVLQEIIFPVSYKERGSCIYWSTLPVINQVIVQGIILQEDDTVAGSEHEFVNVKEFEGFSISELKNTSQGVYIISVKNESGGTGKLILKAAGNETSSTISLDCGGEAAIDIDTGIINVEDELRITVGSKDDEKSTLSISREGVVSYSDRYKNTFVIDNSGIKVKLAHGKFGVQNDEEVFKTLITDLLKMYINTKTIDQKVLDPNSITTATELIIRFNKLLQQ